MDFIIPVSFEELKNRQHLENISGSPVPANKSNNDNGKVFFYSHTHSLTHLLTCLLTHLLTQVYR
jgi:hypothetical protein